jgi:phosphoribosyl-AMP cyclohydrolase
MPNTTHPAPRPTFGPRGSSQEIETGLLFTPKFDADGLIPAIATNARTGQVLMFAWMNQEALALTLQTGAAHFWSRSRKALWKKGEESGNMLQVNSIRTDCDQDVVQLLVTVSGAAVACHTGARSCFYREIDARSIGSGPVQLRPVHQEMP